MVRPNNSSKKEGGREASQAPESPQQPLPQQQQQLKNYNTLAPPLTARSSSEQQRQSERASLLRRLSSGSGTSGGLLSRHRSADDHPLLHSPYTPVADYKTLAMEMAYLTPRRKIPSVRLTGSPAYRGLFSGAGGAADSHHHHHPLQPSPVFPHVTSSPSVAAAARAGEEEAAPLHPGAAASPATEAPQQPGFFRAGSADSVAASLRSPGMIGANDGPGVLTLALFAASILFLFADQNLLAPNLTAVARDFGFDDAQRDIKLGGQVCVSRIHFVN